MNSDREKLHPDLIGVGTAIQFIKDTSNFEERHRRDSKTKENENLESNC